MPVCTEAAEMGAIQVGKRSGNPAPLFCTLSGLNRLHKREQTILFI